MENLHLAAHHLAHEVLDHVGWQPGCAEPGGDVRRRDVARLHALQRLDVTGILAVDRRCSLGGGQLMADRSGQVGVGGLPLLRAWVAEYGVAEPRERIVRRAFQQVAKPLRVHEA